MTVQYEAASELVVTRFRGWDMAIFSTLNNKWRRM
ncbi:hypothetical protein SAMN05444161_7248 [Rhizobiales bacterium GAS191]|jgi:hypothetical protein|nr:hypothetical protein SAMN05519103_06600 [Rhizobiales bacterium GAS113]SED72640.1 hypothetical protein SAMN05519104_4195 [Rhizobiales bacterium GAS188]SEE80893.1 hypothetical protein SAMN05444161_7248 [Rhizobiales bacterium GAS191]